MADISRRTLLSRSALVAGVVAGVGLGFGRHVHHKVAVPPPAPPSGLTDALARQQSLLAGYDKVPSAPAGLKADVTAHGDALRALLENYPGWRLAQSGGVSSSTTPSGGVSTPSSGLAVPTSVAELASVSAALVRSLTTTVLSWPADEANAVTVVPTLASIAASLSTQVAVLS